MELIESICREWSPDFDALRPRQQAQLKESALACLPVFERWLREHQTPYESMSQERTKNALLRKLADELAAMRKEAGDA